MIAPQPLDPGIVIGGHYTVDILINTGGFGSVYRGIDASEGNRPCAIKETYDVTPAARRQALMEAAILFTVKSEHLPQVYDAFEANDEVELTSLGIRFPVAYAYEDVIFEQEENDNLLDK